MVMALARNEVMVVAKNLKQVYHYWYHGMETQALLIIFVLEQQRMIHF